MSFVRIFFLVFIAQPALSLASDLHVLLRHDRSNADAVYRAVASLPAREAHARYRSLPPDMQTDVWLLHLEGFLDRHRELTGEQRGVVLEAIGLLASGMTEVRSESGELTSSATFALGILTQHAKTLLPPELGSEAFSTLSADGSLPLTVNRRVPKVAPQMWGGNPECDCCGASDWCSPTSECKSGSCTMTWGCGTLWMYDCDGICHSHL